MDRPTYWGTMIVSLLVCFMIGYMNPYNAELITGADGVWIIFAWVIGYQRIKDAGHHGAWAIFTPFLIGMVIIGCLRSKEPCANTL